MATYACSRHPLALFIGKGGTLLRVDARAIASGVHPLKLHIIITAPYMHKICPLNHPTMKPRQAKRCTDDIQKEKVFSHRLPPFTRNLDRDVIMNKLPCGHKCTYTGLVLGDVAIDLSVCNPHFSSMGRKFGI
jgi:hypothetical protein